MANNVVYFFGAGASANALPVSGQFHSRLSAFVADMTSNPDAQPIDKDLMDGFTWLLKETANETVDILAKTLYFFRKDHDAFLRLKGLLSCFFTFEQAINPLDRRFSDLLTYFLVPKLGELADLPPQVSFVSWNYDTQLERAFYNILAGLPDPASDDVLRHVMTQLHDRLFHLNGECGTKRGGHYGKEFTLTFGASKKNAYDAIKDMYRAYITAADGSQPDIHFAFEDDKRTQHFLQGLVKDALSKADTIVIVGYSFPDYNEKVDGQMLHMIGGRTKVYLQVSPIDTEIVIKRMNRLMKINVIQVEPWQNLDSFYKPLF
jgi:hypothetical protein